MAKTFWRAALCAVVMSLASSCKTHESINNEYAYREFPTQFISKTRSGEITIKCWGSGTSSASAADNALINGLETILFKGLTTGSNPVKPLVTSRDTPASRDYFDRFFNEGIYRSYIKQDKSIPRTEAKSANLQQIGLTAVVDVKALESLLVKDNIITR